MTISIDLIIILRNNFKEEISQGEDHLLITEGDHLLIIEVGRLLTIELNQEILTQLLTVTTNNKIRKKEI